MTCSDDRTAKVNEFRTKPPFKVILTERARKLTRVLIKAAVF
jgi:hypothetical protein